MTAQTLCPRCQTPLKTVTRKTRATGGGACALELLGLIILLTTFWTIIGAVAGILVIYLGHRAAYQYNKVLHCPACATQYPAPPP